MATKKITELTELAGSDLATTDVIAIVDIDADATKKLTIQGLGDNMTVATASYAHTASIEITKEVSSSHANTADTAAGLTGQPSIYVTNITASGVISASGGVSYFKGLDVANGSILNVGGIECDQLLYAEDTTNLFNLSANDFSFDLGEVRYVQINSTGTTFGVDTVGYHITSSGNISASGIITADTGSFSHLKGNSPITVGSGVNFKQGITGSNMTLSGSLDVIDPFGPGKITFSGSILHITGSVKNSGSFTTSGSFVIQGGNLDRKSVV